jgi:hypothetical protein
MAELIKKRVAFEGGREETLSKTGSNLLFFGLAGGAISAFIGMVSGQNTAVCVIGGILIALNAIVVNALLQSFAEVIRLLKKQNGLEYGGSILPVTPFYEFACSECGSEQSDTPLEWCWKCKSTFDAETP